MELSLNFDDHPGPYLAYDGAGTVVSANRAALDILGVSSEDLLGSNAADAGWSVTDAAGWPDAENLHPALAAIRSRQPQRGVVARVIRPDGAEVWIQVEAVPVATATGGFGHVVAALADVTRILNDVRLPRPGYGDAAVAEVTDELAGARPDPESILRTVTGALSNLRHGTWLAALMNKDPRTVRAVAANHADPAVASYVENIQLSGAVPSFTISNRVIETGEPVLIPSVPFEEFAATLRSDIREYLEENQPPFSSPIRTLGILVVPMRARGAIVGTLGVFERPCSNPLTERDVKWVQEIADRTGLAAENAQLYTDAVKRLGRLTALHNVGRAITGSPDTNLTLQVILDQTVGGLGVDAADVLLVDEKDGMLTQAVATGFKSTSIPDYRIPIDEAVPGRVVGGRKIETVTGSGALTRFRRGSLFAREGFQAYSAVPLVAHGKVAGVLEVFHRSPLEPDQEWLDFFDSMGNEAAIAIDNAGMFDRLRELGPEGPPKSKSPAPDLTRLELQILGHLVEGLPNRVIADKVHLSPHTIKFHIRQMFAKLEVRNRTELARKATREGWL